VDEVRTKKRGLRRQLRLALAKISPEERAASSSQAVRILQSRVEWQQAACILFFAPLQDELDLWPLLIQSLREGRTVTLPRYDPAKSEYGAAQILDLGTDLVHGQLGILEPSAACRGIPLIQLDFALVPGLGFDLSGRRLGRGRGYFDRLLTRVRGVTCGVAHDCQVLSVLPTEGHDRTVDCIVTPTRWLACRRQPAGK
jgi:5-formyltetrahydrofolate cyclo-ligase